jgi:hypothetical protein
MPAIPAGAHIQTNVCATRDAILEALKQLSEVESAMSALMAIYEVRLEQSGKSIAIEERAIAFREVYREAFRSFCKARCAEQICRDSDNHVPPHRTSG